MAYLSRGDGSFNLIGINTLPAEFIDYKITIHIICHFDEMWAIMCWATIISETNERQLKLGPKSGANIKPYIIASSI